MPYMDRLSTHPTLMSLENGDFLARRVDEFLVFSSLKQEWIAIKDSEPWQTGPFCYPRIFGIMQRNETNVEFFVFERGIKTLSIYELRDNRIVWKRSIYVYMLGSERLFYIRYFSKKFHLICNKVHIMVENSPKQLQTIGENYPGIFLGFSVCVLSNGSNGSNGSSMVLFCDQNEIYEYTTKWRELKAAFPYNLSLTKNLIVSANYGHFCLIFSLNKSKFSNISNIFIFNNITQQITCSRLQLNLDIINCIGVFVSSPVKDKLLVFGFTREFKFPDYLMEFMCKWFVKEYVHVINTVNGKHFRINVDEIMD